MLSVVRRAYKAVKKRVVKAYRATTTPVARYVVEHPIRTTVYIARAVLILYPGAMMGPFWVLTLGMSRTRAMVVASAIRSYAVLGPAGGLFAILQTAAIAGPRQAAQYAGFRLLNQIQQEWGLLL
ncbi:uncharacterized protein BDZ99DRAFT_570791 [Mytilinidion resinicola]|uniref:Uncharacterized protein n=1 Tax=Mytilinidion resinicola TaxID=574789 RepID=A0A6A6YQ93_9PEZI|nr:uncharacterized protein BDZ99DRAFT_570791 [Mytilinidion resinicola]KAF2810184.1 hypothetical protein BDZ99DRAFT_570791 [Mytilinidion resinicola]